MRIAHVITRLIIGGAQENTVLCCRDLRDIYRDQVLLVTGPPLGPEGSLIEQAKTYNIPLVVVPSLRRAIHPARDLHAQLSLRRILREFRPDVVHTHSAKAGILGRRVASSLRVAAIVHTVHGAPFHPYQNRLQRGLYRWCERYAAQKCHALVSVADAMTELLVSTNVAPRDKFTTIYSGMDVEAFLKADGLRDATRRRLGYAEGHIVIGKVARLFHLKGHEDVIQAARRIVARCPQARFLLVGDGMLRPRLERQIAAAGLSAHFHFAGLIPPAEIPAYLAAMDVVVHTSLREGLARVLPQALIAGKPVVSYDIDGAREVVLPGSTGFLIPPRRIDELTEALIQLVEDADLCQQLGAAGRERFALRFRHQYMTDELRKLYERLLQRQRAAAADLPP